ncbi:unnamed protein product [Caenorhabditis sp. 36 PRJEB53466]|nr:unnamed protein product [Caenorhabditis sp. 36 PRJEB53466]CAI2347781.1 unnamed protein product [Caenorhabditis sp. 36 PRJEB53466]
MASYTFRSFPNRRLTTFEQCLADHHAREMFAFMDAIREDFRLQQLKREFKEAQRQIRKERRQRKAYFRQQKRIASGQDSGLGASPIDSRSPGQSPPTRVPLYLRTSRKTSPASSFNPSPVNLVVNPFFNPTLAAQIQQKKQPILVKNPFYNPQLAAQIGSL